MNRKELGDLIVERLELKRQESAAQYAGSEPKIGYFYVDDLLPGDIARRIFDAFPATTGMHLKKSLREYKFVAAQMDRYDPILEEIIYAFQDQRVVSLIAGICGIERLYPDEHLYAGGISLMQDNHFLNPHLDNSHDKDRDKWRVLNLLYYVSPGWDASHGGSLELWPDGLKGAQIAIPSEFNRLLVMATHDKSWHSVSPISSSGGSRCCVSNYYFSDVSLKPSENFHVTSFRGRPEQRLRDHILRADIGLRMGLRKIFKKGVVENKQVYKRPT
jgi:Rps23 Pro-64 3,4-dihydroxylase Tpa1-like proline 4-hydroxylase